MGLLRGALLVLVLLAAAAGFAGWWAFQDRPDPAEAGLAFAPVASDVGGVRATWLGVTTLLFDDGETRILIDGFFSRPDTLTVVRDLLIEPDAAGIDAALAQAGITSVAAITPVHSHYDHALDTAEVAKRTGAMVLGSRSTLQLARGAGLDDARLVDLTDGGSLRFGEFEVTLIRSRHMPIDDAGNPPFPGTIDEPLVPPARVSAWKEGASYSIFLAHPRGTTLVQGSAGFVPGALEGRAADVVFLGVGGLGRLGEDYTDRYWQEVVAPTGAKRVIPVHWDDFMQPYGVIRTPPRLVDDPVAGFSLLVGLAEAQGARVELPRFGQPISLY